MKPKPKHNCKYHLQRNIDYIIVNLDLRFYKMNELTKLLEQWHISYKFVLNFNILHFFSFYKMHELQKLDLFDLL